MSAFESPGSRIEADVAAAIKRGEDMTTFGDGWRVRNELHGSATLQRHDDGTITVIEADDVIGVACELWQHLEPEHKPEPEVIVLDTAGSYRYRYVRTICSPFGEPILTFERIRETK